nr:M56 family metallopeptidase [Algibacter pectinivorans]
MVLNPNSFNKTELQQIITHEKIHANQKHTLDVLIGQLACIALWFNPVIWFYNKDLKQNLEFIADFKTQNTFDPKSYQSTLLKTTLAHHQMQFSNNFYNSLIKKRIVMLHKSKSKKVNLLKHTLVLPLLALFLIACSSKEATKPETQEYQTSIRKTASNANDTASNSDPLVYLDGKEVPNNTIKSINPETIEAVNVLKNEKAFEKYGDKGKHGVIEITTKK